ncbi:MAG: beta-propeller fold lactonase family protein [Erythrobacter sp.]|uniref:beta-propeller fold lactonase family protein n=1 Tax=Erythrobacter sp. TaxID=1042 RepID=UPI0032EB9075
MKAAIIALAGALALMPGAIAARSGPDAMVEVENGRVKEGVPLPTFKVDASWPKLPGDLILGQVPGLAVASDDTIWILTRPNSLNPTEIGRENDPPLTAACCKAPPHVLQFDSDGNLLRSWGGPALAPGESAFTGEGRDRVEEGDEQWPANVHGLYVDEAGTVWIGGNGNGDHVVLNFTQDGEFIRQIGRRQVTKGNLSETYLGNPADIAHDGKSVLVADGYTNTRVIAFASEDLSFEQLWGAYGTEPGSGTRGGAFDQSMATSTAEGGPDPQAGDFEPMVHCVVRGPEDTVYVCDRRNNRVQVFREGPDGIEFLENVVIAPETGGTRTASDVAFSPDGTYVYVADMMNGRVWILTRADHEIVGWFGRNGRYPGQFIWLHSVDVDSEGNVYTSEVNTGRRVQRFVFEGYEE